MAEKRNVDRLTLFSPVGDRIRFVLASYGVQNGVLHFTDTQGISFETTLPFAIEHVEQGHVATPFG
jgi:hypothetical protein